MWLAACAWCNRIRRGDEWLEAGAVVTENADRPMRVTHTICPECFERAHQFGARS
jgi:hypothetical protein